MRVGSIVMIVIGLALIIGAVVMYQNAKSNWNALVQAAQQTGDLSAEDATIVRNAVRPGGLFWVMVVGGFGLAVGGIVGFSRSGSSGGHQRRRSGTQRTARGTARQTAPARRGTGRQMAPARRGAGRYR